MLTPLNDLQVCGGCSHICAQHQGRPRSMVCKRRQTRTGRSGARSGGSLEDSLGSVVLRTTLPTGCNHGLRFSFHSRATYTGVLRNPNARPCSGCVSTRWRPKLRFFDRCVPCAPNDLQVVFVRRCELRAMHARKPEGRSGGADASLLLSMEVRRQ